MIRKNKLLTLFYAVVFSAILLSLSSCGEDPPPPNYNEYWPEQTAYRFYDHDGSYLEEIVHPTSMGEPFWSTRPDIPTRDYYEFLGFFTEPGEGSGGLQVLNESCGLSASFDYGNFIKRQEPIGTLSVQLHARYKKIIRAVNFTSPEGYILSEGERYTLECHRDIHPDLEPPTGVTAVREGEEFVGWFDSDGNMIYDENGALQIELTELYLKANEHYDSQEVHWLDKVDYPLYALFGTPRKTLTLDFGIGTVENKKLKVEVGAELSQIALPSDISAPGRYLVGWSLSKTENLTPTGTVEEDLTLYAVWTEAKALTLDVMGERIPAYLLSNGEMIATEPPVLNDPTVGITGYYTDSGFEEKLPDYSLVLEGATVYCKVGKVVKEIYLEPNNGEAAYKVRIALDPAKSELTLPTYDGNVIEGFYTDPDFEGEPVELDFESVTDGTTYYVKWKSIN